MYDGLDGKKILVTGATGFVGGRLIERIALGKKTHVRALVRSFARTTRIARFDIEMVHGDILDTASTANAVQGCDIVFHCAWGDRKVNVEGTKNIMDAVHLNSVEKVVHLSTISVYGNTPDGNLSENMPRQRTGDEYGDSKLDGEELVLEYHQKHELPVVILQPTVVYGPWSPTWTITPLSQLSSGKVMLINGGSGYSNALYVDDLINAMLIAAVKPAASGQTFIISGDTPVPWCDFYGAYEKMLKQNSTIDFTLDGALELHRKKRRSNSTIAQIRRALREHPEVVRGIIRLPIVQAPYNLARKIIPEELWSSTYNWLSGKNTQPSSNGDAGKSTHILNPEQAKFFARKTIFLHRKAESVLGYKPKFNIDVGMKLTERWARWAGLIK